MPHLRGLKKVHKKAAEKFSLHYQREYYPHQLEEEGLDIWWQKKYKEIKDSQLNEETIREKLMEINEIYEDLSTVDEKLLF